MYNFKVSEPEIRKYWKKINLLKKLQEKNKKNDNYFYMDGPPYANFVPHVGHVRNTVYKDLGIRLAFMKGFNVLFQPGFDTHGLPVENVVEKKLNLKSKKDIEILGIDKFTKTCKELAATNKDLWLEVYDLLGSWYSWKEPYLTYNNSYIESGWWSFKQMWDKGLVYEGQKPVFWCPKCETALAGYEVTDSYIMKTDPSIILKFKIKDKDEYILVFTTTPWTLLSNVAIVAHPDEIYVKVETHKGKLIIAKKRLDLFTDLGIGYKIIEEFKGKKLEGLEYESIIDVPMQEELKKNPKSHKVYMSIPILKERIASKVATKKKVGESGDVFEHFVNVEEGTGFVHTAPGHGKTDNEIGQKYDLPEASPLDDSCKFTKEGGQFEGVFVKDADKEILQLLEREGKLLHKDYAEHKYPVCWRCKEPLIFRMSNQWFLRINRNEMIKLNKNVNWLPKYANERFENWILNAEDWNISRQRYWGIPMPVWKCECGNIEIIESLKELSKKSSHKIKNDFDLHNVSDVKLKCKCGKHMTRIKDIFDVWFDSGIAPWASLGYPLHNKELFESNFPVSRINESQDQVRGWFYHLLYCSQTVFNKSSYMEVSMPGWVVDSKGQKMSKSLGNVVFAKDALENYGADALRFYYMWDIAPYDLQRFNEESIKKEVSRVFNILWNINTYIIGKVNNNTKTTIKRIEDKWIISKLNTLIKECRDALDNFEYHVASRKLENFILNTFSREYIHLIRDREDNQVDYILFEVLKELCVLLAPISPFITEKIYQDLKKKFKLKEESIHLFDYPKTNTKLIDSELEENMDKIKEIVSIALSERDKEKLGVRWPIPSIEIYYSKSLKEFEDIIKTQVNVKKIIWKKGELSVKLNKNLDEELLQEGYSREVIRLVQDCRKKLGLKKEQFIDLYIISEQKLIKKMITDKVGVKKFDIVIERPKAFDMELVKDIKEKRFEIFIKKL